jgi:hypothetical protein
MSQDLILGDILGIMGVVHSLEAGYAGFVESQPEMMAWSILLAERP